MTESGRMAAGLMGKPSDMPLTTPVHKIDVALRPVPESVRRARRALIEGGLDPDLEHTVSLLTSELVTNSVRHVSGADEIRIEATLTEGYAKVDVIDRGPGFDPDVRHTIGGFGLRLVDKLATRWGVDHPEDQTHVWFEVDRRRRRFGRQPG
jgi:two-component sensor histidine kinase